MTMATYAENYNYFKDEQLKKHYMKEGRLYFYNRWMVYYNELIKTKTKKEKNYLLPDELFEI
jgi:hypothetical protein